MANLPEIETLSDDSGKSYFRSQRIRARSKTVVTPTRVLEPRRAAVLPKYDTSTYSVVELFTEFNRDGIAKLQNVTERVNALESRLRAQDRSGSTSATRVCFAQYRPSVKGGWPEEKELLFLTDLVHSYSDIVPIPSVARSIELGDVRGLFTHVDRSIRLIERLNDKPLMGWIPVAMPRGSYEKLLDHYLKHDVRAFCVDFAGRIPSHLQMRPILARLAERNLLGQTVLYGLNARPGKFIKNAKEIPSRDFFAYGYGLDVLGGSHLRAFVPPEPENPSKMDLVVARRLANRKRIFVRKTYGYHRVDSVSEAESVLPKRSPVAAKSLLDSPDRAIEKAFNMDQQCLEAGEISRRLGELGRGESILEYVMGKRLARDAIPNFRKQHTLF
jgi:hypothetical protein